MKEIRVWYFDACGFLVFFCASQKTSHKVVTRGRVPAQRLVFILYGHVVKQLRNHLHHPPGWLRNAPPVFGLGVSPLHQLLLGRLLQSLV